MDRVADLIRVLVLLLIALGAGLSPAHAHGLHHAPAPKVSDAGIDARAVASVPSDGSGQAGCVLHCCAGGGSCIAHVAAPARAPQLPEPGPSAFSATPGRVLSEFARERLPKPPRAA